MDDIICLHKVAIRVRSQFDRTSYKWTFADAILNSTEYAALAN